VQWWVLMVSLAPIIMGFIVIGSKDMREG